MDFRYLKAFIAAVEQGSFSKAADELNIAQSAVSRQVKLLEESIDDELLIRSTKHLSLTPKGKRLYDALKHFEKETTTLLSDDERTTIRIGIPHGMLESWFQALLGEYYKAHDSNLTITVGGLSELREGIEAGRFDLIFTPFEIDSELISSRAVLDENLAIISRDPINPEKLLNYRWIIYGPEDLLLKIHRKTPKRVVQVNSITAMIKLVKQGIGIAVLPDHMIYDQSELRSYKKDTLPRQTIFASHLRYRKAPESLEALIKLLPKP
ncbi:MAG: LysR family transcriptional regulator [Bdellovibrionota bacterium]|nr:MAG: LysR family transcriptional regulator [Pseudomonadota bacterium]